MSFGQSLLFGLLVASLAAGCEPPPLDYFEVKRIDEPVTRAEFESFVRIVEALPGRRLPEFPSLFVAAPDWPESRTLPVSDLVRQEATMIDDRWSVDAIAEPLARHRTLQRALARERMSAEQFVGLALALGAALSRSGISDDHDLKGMLKKGDLEVERLEEDHRSFASLSEEARHAVLQRGAWVTRRARVERLLLVPIDNIDLARAHREWLTRVCPEEFSRNPFADVVDWSEELGVPFVETDATGRDAELEWSRDAALVGH